MTVVQDFRVLLGPIRDQGIRPTCLAMATSDAHAAHRHAPQTQLSCEYLFYHAKQYDQTPPDEGTTVDAVQETLRHQGQPLETVWQYEPQLVVDPATWKPPANVTTLYKANSVSSQSAFSTLVQAVVDGHISVVIVSISPAFFIPQMGVVDAVEPLTSILHALVAVGLAHDGSRRFILFRNSWGSSWGDNGHAWLSDTYLQQRIQQVFRITH